MYPFCTRRRLPSIRFELITTAPRFSKNCTSPLMVFSVDRGLATLDNLDAAPTFDAFRFTRAAPPA